jgi:hypothetical protein
VAAIVRKSQPPIAGDAASAQIAAMLTLAFGALTLFLFLGGLRAFEQTSVTTIKALAVWIAALGGLTLMLLLVLTGRGGIALWGLVMVGPLAWRHLRGHLPGMSAFFTGDTGGGSGNGPGSRSGSGNGSGAGGQAFRPRSATMTRQEAYEVLGLRPGASEADIRAAYHRVMRTAHPDAGGSDWLAARVNMARDLLLGGKHA